MKKLVLVAVALLSIAQGAVAGQDVVVETVGQKDPWKNGNVSPSSIICEKQGAKQLPVEQSSERSASKSASRSLRGI